MSIIGDSFLLKNPDAVGWIEGWNLERPYNWGNLYAIKNPDGRQVYKDNPDALFIKYGSDTDWDFDRTFVVPSGCLWKKADAFDGPDGDQYIEDWRKAYCKPVKQMN